jgi:hypothetical protein
MNVTVNTHIDGAPTNITGHPQYEDFFMVGIYQRSGAELTGSDFNFFGSRNSYSTTWDGHELLIYLEGKGDIPTVNIKLIWHERSQMWSGLFELGAFRGQVLLKRPIPPAERSPLVGTWFEKDLGSRCLHISQAKDGAFAAWSDDLQIPGRMRYANGLQPPAKTIERYGELAAVKMDSSDQVMIELGAYSAMCCSQPFTAKVSADGQSLSGSWLPGANRAVRPANWVKVAGNSCIPARELATY